MDDGDRGECNGTNTNTTNSTTIMANDTGKTTVSAQAAQAAQDILKRVFNDSGDSWSSSESSFSSSHAETHGKGEGTCPTLKQPPPKPSSRINQTPTAASANMDATTTTTTTTSMMNAHCHYKQLQQQQQHNPSSLSHHGDSRVHAGKDETDDWSDWSSSSSSSSNSDNVLVIAKRHKRKAARDATTVKSSANGNGLYRTRHGDYHSLSSPPPPASSSNSSTGNSGKQQQAARRTRAKTTITTTTTMHWNHADSANATAAQPRPKKRLALSQLVSTIIAPTSATTTNEATTTATTTNEAVSTMTTTAPSAAAAAPAAASSSLSGCSIQKNHAAAACNELDDDSDSDLLSTPDSNHHADKGGGTVVVGTGNHHQTTTTSPSSIMSRKRSNTTTIAIMHEANADNDTYATVTAKDDKATSSSAAAGDRTCSLSSVLPCTATVDDCHHDCWKSSCWKCHVRLQPHVTDNTDERNKNENANFCLYAMHLHPLLDVPICSVCADQVLDVVQVATAATACSKRSDCTADDDDIDDDVLVGCCSGCACGQATAVAAAGQHHDKDSTFATQDHLEDDLDDDNNDDDDDGEEPAPLLLLCDDCPRAFCEICVAQAHGGGKDGRAHLQALLQQDESTPWSCLCCAPPAPLQALQAHVMGNLEQDDKGQAAQSPQAPRTLETVVLELEKVEIERKECERTDDPNVVEEKRAEILAELVDAAANDGTMSTNELHKAVEREVRQWKELWTKHDLRLADRALALQEEIELLGGNLLGCYAAILGQEDTHTQDCAEPAWKRAADAELLKRQEQEDEDDCAPLQNPSDPSVYEKEIPEDVEDLGPISSEPGDKSKKRSQWRTSKKRARMEDVEKVLEHEDKILQERSIPIIRVFNDMEDVKASKDEEELAAGRDKNGMSRIRRDEVMLRQTELRGDDRPRKKQRVSSTGASRTFPSSHPRQKDMDQLNMSNAFDLIEDTDDAPSSSSGESVFGNSSVLLSSHELIERAEGDNEKSSSVRTVSIAAPLADNLKEHQIQGVKFIWKNCFADLAIVDPSEEDLGSVGGCILAHNMGLGKSLTCISLLHALLRHPSLVVNTSNETSPEHLSSIRTNHSRLIRTVLLIVPTNVVSNWEDEFDKWTGQLFPSVTVYNLGAMIAGNARTYTVNAWMAKGGVLLVSSHMFARLVKSSMYSEALLNPGPDIVVADEAHTMLTNTSNEIFKALSEIRTKRRVGLTGSPIQNNLFEYFRMVRWIRPKVLGSSEANFDKEYAEPIMLGLASDASAYAVRSSNEASRKLHHILSPYVQRKDAQVLRKELPAMQQVILHIRQTKAQARLYRAFKSYRKVAGLSNFFACYHMIRPIHNHPATLVISNESGDEAVQNDDIQSVEKFATPLETTVTPQALAASRVADNRKFDCGELEIIDLSSNSDNDNGVDKLKPAKASDAGASESTRPRKESALRIVNEVTDESCTAADAVKTNVSTSTANAAASSTSHGLPPSGRAYPSASGGDEWWRKTVERHGGVENLKEAEHGYKIVLLLHILVKAQSLGDKVIIFAQCLKTLDFIEYVLSLDDWTEHVPSLASSSGRLGGWKKNIDYLRIDGNTQTSVRGELIARFNGTNSSRESKSQSRDQAKAFLLSAKACGIGINLTAANRVVLFDQHFNPTVMTQALYRCYRYGQTKPVFAYRFMTEGSSEEKIYSRSVNKTGVALRVLDNKTILRSFSAREVRDLEQTDTWVQCDRCEKWRMLPVIADLDQLPDKWYCEMNELDSVNNSCDASEKDTRWYYRHFSETFDVLKDSPVKCIASETIDSALSKDEKAKLVESDTILTHLFNVTAGEQKSSVISKYYFHDALLSETEEFAVNENAAKITGAEAPSEGGKPQTIPPSLIESVDRTYANADLLTMTVSGILRSLESQYSMTFENEAKTLVRHRLKELMKDSSQAKSARSVCETAPSAATSCSGTKEERSTDDSSKQAKPMQAAAGHDRDAASVEMENASSGGQEVFTTLEKMPQPARRSPEESNVIDLLSDSSSGAQVIDILSDSDSL